MRLSVNLESLCEPHCLRGPFWTPVTPKTGSLFHADQHSGITSLRGIATALNDREMVDILALVLHHDEQAVLTAVELALAEGVPTKTHVINLLHRLIDGKTIGGPDLDTPQALVLRREPKANVERYDGLRT